MVKDEVDVVEDWLNYHGKMFGFKNLYVIDNYSRDGTYEVLKRYEKEKGIVLLREKEYSKKGEFMRHLMKDHYSGRECDIAYPLDIDEFICYYNKNLKLLKPDKTVEYMSKLNKNIGLYKTNYIGSCTNTNDNIGHVNGVKDILYGIYNDKMGYLAKTFINNNLYYGDIDHGNHMPVPSNKFLLTDIVLVHYHLRNKEQLEKKVVNNLIGLGYKDDKKYLENLMKTNPGAPGNHHVQKRIDMLNNKYNYNFSHHPNRNTIHLKPIINYLTK
jgi:hypothetical protein